MSMQSICLFTPSRNHMNNKKINLINEEYDFKYIKY